MIRRAELIVVPAAGMTPFEIVGVSKTELPTEDRLWFYGETCEGEPPDGPAVGQVFSFHLPSLSAEGVATRKTQERSYYARLAAPRCGTLVQCWLPSSLHRDAQYLLRVGYCVDYPPFIEKDIIQCCIILELFIVNRFCLAAPKMFREVTI